MAVGFWNFVGAGVFGFLINTPIVSYYEVGTILTVNHGHAAFIGVFGMLGVGLMVYVLREVSQRCALAPDREVPEGRVLGTQHRARHDDRPEPVSRRPAAGLGRIAERLLARALDSTTRATRARGTWSGCARRATWCSSSSGVLPIVIGAARVLPRVPAQSRGARGAATGALMHLGAMARTGARVRDHRCASDPIHLCPRIAASVLE